LEQEREPLKSTDTVLNPAWKEQWWLLRWGGSRERGDFGKEGVGEHAVITTNGTRDGCHNIMSQTHSEL
jgi:hypothetical protein